MKTSLLLALVFITTLSFSQDQAFQIYNSKGKKVSYKKVIKSCRGVDLTFFGEYHNNPICHWLELELIKSLSKEDSLTVGVEMIERDNNDLLQEYINGKIDQKSLDTLARLWQNHKTDYKPLIDYSKDNNINFIGTNIPRRHANLVYKNGFQALDTLPTLELSYIAPLPLPYDSSLACYRSLSSMMPHSHSATFLAEAQATKDATMGYFTAKNLKKETLYLHINGAYHSDNHQGIVWYVNHYSPETTIITISTVSQKDINKLEEENKNKADFIICIDEDMTKTY